MSPLGVIVLLIVLRVVLFLLAAAVVGMGKARWSRR